MNLEVLRLDVRENLAFGLDGKLVLERDRPLEAALNDHVARAQQIGLDHRPPADDAARSCHACRPSCSSLKEQNRGLAVPSGLFRAYWR